MPFASKRMVRPGKKSVSGNSKRKSRYSYSAASIALSPSALSPSRPAPTMYPSTARALPASISRTMPLRQHIQDEGRECDSIRRERRQPDAADKTHEEFDTDISYYRRNHCSKRELTPWDS